MFVDLEERLLTHSLLHVYFIRSADYIDIARIFHNHGIEVCDIEVMSTSRPFEVLCLVPTETVYDKMQALVGEILVDQVYKVS